MGSAPNNATKETRLGPLPKEWHAVPLKSYGHLTDGDWILKKYYTRQGVRLLQVGDVGIGRFVDKSNRFISHESADELGCTFLRVGQIMISRMPDPIGRACFVPEFPYPAITAVDVAILTPDQKVVDPLFAVFALNSEINISQCDRLATGATRQRISRNNLSTVLLPLPPLPEQRAIAHVLRTVQRAKEATEKVIAATRTLKQSLMRHLFTYGPVPFDQAGQVELRETELREIPSHWELRKLGDLTRIGNGSTPKRTNTAYWERGTVPWLTSGKIHEVVIQHADEFVTPTAQSECHLPVVKAGSVLVAITGQGKTLGNAAMVTFDTCISQHLAYVQFKDSGMVPEFVLAFLQGRYGHFRQVAGSGGSTKGALTCGFLKGYTVPVPPIEEQRLIAETLHSLERKLESERGKEGVLDDLFRTALHLLMTGKVRVHDLDLDRREGR